MTDVGGVPMVSTGFGGGDGGWMGMLLVLALLGGGGGIFGGRRDGEGLNFHDRNMENHFLGRDLFGIQRDILTQGEVAMRNADRNSFELNRNIDGLRFDSERNTSRIVENASQNTQRILDKMCADELRIAYARIAEQGQALSEARIINAMKPQPPIPAYLQPNPFANFSGNGCCPGSF